MQRESITIVMVAEDVVGAAAEAEEEVERASIMEATTIHIDGEESCHNHPNSN